MAHKLVLLVGISQAIVKKANATSVDSKASTQKCLGFFMWTAI
jgi:hypothetical protein